MSYQTFDAITLNVRPVAEELAVVIPTLGRPILEGSLCSIAIGTMWPGQLVVVDQGNSSTVEDWIEHLRVARFNAEYVGSSERGRAKGVNAGLSLVTTEFVAITDDDCFADRTWIEVLHAHMISNPRTIATGRVEVGGSEPPLFSVTSLEPRVVHRPRLAFDRLSGGNMATSMAVFHEVGFFDDSEALRTAEDGEWAYRALKACVPIFYLPQAMVVHYGWRDSTDRTAQYRMYARSHGGFYGKYIRRGDWFIGLRAAYHHVRALRTTLRGVMTGNRELRKLGWSYFTGLLPGILRGMRQAPRE